MDGHRGPFPMHWEHADGRHPFLHLVVLALLLLLVVMFAVFVYRLATRGRTTLSPAAAFPGVSPADVLSIVRLRYAKGEIKRDEFIRMCADFGAPVDAADEPPASPA